MNEENPIIVACCMSTKWPEISEGLGPFAKRIECICWSQCWKTEKKKRESLAKSPLQVKMDSDGADGRNLWGGGEASDEGEEGSRGGGRGSWLWLRGREGSHPH